MMPRQATPTELRRERCKHRMADKLSRLTNGILEVEFAPTTFIDADDDSRGHQFCASFEDAEAATLFWMDDRRADSIGIQLVNELRKKAHRLMRVARKLQRAIDSGTPLSRRRRLYAVVVVERPEGWKPKDNFSKCRGWTNAVAIAKANVARKDARGGSATHRLKGGSIPDDEIERYWRVVMPMEEADALGVPSWKEFAAPIY